VFPEVQVQGRLAPSLALLGRAGRVWFGGQAPITTCRGATDGADPLPRKPGGAGDVVRVAWPLDRGLNCSLEDQHKILTDDDDDLDWWHRLGYLLQQAGRAGPP
jgi:hypothetical protein